MPKGQKSFGEAQIGGQGIQLTQALTTGVVFIALIEKWCLAIPIRWLSFKSRSVSHGQINGTFYY